MKHRQKLLSVCLLAMGGALSMAPIQGAWAQPALGAASAFAALGTTTVTCATGGVVGDVGVSPGTSITGFTNLCSLVGSLHSNDTAAGDAVAASALAYTELAAITCPRPEAAYNLAGDLSGLTLPPGVYCIAGVGTLSGELVLDGGKDAVWIFTADAFTTTPGGSVVMAGGGKACNVYWQTDFEATFAGTDFLGTILAGSNISFDTSTLVGRALAGTAVTMDTSFITLSGASGDSLKEDKKAFEAEQKAEKESFKAQQEADEEDFLLTNPDYAAKKAFKDVQHAAKKAFEDLQHAAKKAFNEQQKAAKC